MGNRRSDQHLRRLIQSARDRSLRAGFIHLQVALALAQERVLAQAQVLALAQVELEDLSINNQELIADQS